MTECNRNNRVYLIDRIAFTVNCNYDRKILNSNSAHGFGAEVIKIKYFRLLYTFAIDCACSAYCGKVYAAEPRSSIYGVYLSILQDVVGPALPSTSPFLAGQGPIKYMVSPTKSKA